MFEKDKIKSFLLSSHFPFCSYWIMNFIKNLHKAFLCISSTQNEYTTTHQVVDKNYLLFVQWNSTIPHVICSFNDDGWLRLYIVLTIFTLFFTFLLFLHFFQTYFWFLYFLPPFLKITILFYFFFSYPYTYRFDLISILLTSIFHFFFSFFPLITCASNVVWRKICF